jgi:uncharacterized protein YceH (UPF0502 family)
MKQQIRDALKPAAFKVREELGIIGLLNGLNDLSARIDALSGRLDESSRATNDVLVHLPAVLNAISIGNAAAREAKRAERALQARVEALEAELAALRSLLGEGGPNLGQVVASDADA